MMMRFEKILPNGRLWATVYEGEETNTLDATFSQWEDVAWLKSFFENNISDLSSYFHITDVNHAIDVNGESAKCAYRSRCRR